MDTNTHATRRQTHVSALTRQQVPAARAPQGFPLRRSVLPRSILPHSRHPAMAIDRTQTQRMKMYASDSRRATWAAQDHALHADYSSICQPICILGSGVSSGEQTDVCPCCHAGGILEERGDVVIVTCSRRLAPLLHNDRVPPRPQPAAL